MKSEKGVTLVELLATLVIIGIIVALSMSIFMSGNNSANRTTSNQKLQQEANYIVEKVRSEYLKSNNQLIKIEISISGLEQSLLLNGSPISQGYIYNTDVTEIDPLNEAIFKMKITDTTGQFYNIKTTFSKLQ